MSRYRVRIQLVKWYEIVVNAPSPEDAIAKAEGMRPLQIQKRGKSVAAETGLADPDSAELIEPGKPEKPILTAPPEPDRSDPPVAGEASD